MNRYLVVSDHTGVLYAAEIRAIIVDGDGGENTDTRQISFLLEGGRWAEVRDTPE